MWTLRKEMIVALAGVCLSYGTTTQAASIDIAAKPVSVQTSEQSLLTGKETASKQAAWEAFWQGLLNSRVVPDDYTKTVKTSGAIERTYLSDGPHKTARQSLQTQKPMEQYEIYYPVDLLEKRLLVRRLSSSMVQEFRPADILLCLSIWHPGALLPSATKIPALVQDSRPILR